MTTLHHPFLPLSSSAGHQQTVPESLGRLSSVREVWPLLERFNTKPNWNVSFCLDESRSCTSFSDSFFPISSFSVEWYLCHIYCAVRGRRYRLAKMFHKTWANTETHTNTPMCTHTYTYRKAMPSEKPAISPYYWDFFPQLPNMKRELGDLLQRVSRWQKNWILLEVPLLTHYLTSSKPPVMNVGHSLSICKAGVSILTFCKPCSACKWGFQRTVLFWE